MPNVQRNRSRALQRVAVLAMVALGCLFCVSSAQAGVGANAAPTFPTLVTVGQTGIPASIEVGNQNTPPNAGATNTVCNFGDPFPCPAGEPGITLIPSCGQLGAFSVCSPAGADPGAFVIPAVAQGRAGTACAGMLFDVTQIDATFGTLRFTPQGGANVLLPGNGALCIIDFTFDVIKRPDIDQNPVAPETQTVQIVDNTQYSGTITGSARGTSQGTTVLRATPTIATTASPDITIGAGTLTDTVVVSGRVNPQPGATITWRLYAPGDTACTGTPVFTASGFPYPVAGGPLTSPAYTPTTAGTYRWIASYSGDQNNAPIAGACNDANENVVVNQATPTIATTASPDITIGAGTLTDTVVVSGRVNPQPGATITWRLYAPGDTTCTGTPVFTASGFPYPVAGGPLTSPAYTPTTAGTYRWIASYSGDVNNAPIAGACNDANENVVVNQATPTIATTASPDITIGAGTLTDTVVVSGRVNPQPGATITWRLYAPGDTTCTGTPVFTASGFPYPVAGGPVTSPAYTPTTAGTYRWIASYSGDVNNAPIAGACNDANENVVVNQATPTIATTASPDMALGAGTLTDTVVVSGRSNPQAGATVDFRLYAPGDATCAGAPVFTDLGVAYPVAGGPVTSAAYTPTAPGTYRWVVSYSGDVNNAPVTGACNDANESTVVSRATPTITTTASPDMALGAGTLTDTVVVSGRSNPQPGATVDFRLYAPGDATCAGAPVFTDLGVAYPVAGGPVTSAAYTPTAPGTYRWVVSYSGDANNAPVTGACNDANESTVVSQATPQIATTASPNITLGAGTLTDTVVVSGRSNPQPGATVDFRLYAPGDTTCTGNPVFTDLGVAYPVAGGPVTSAAYTPTMAGTYRWVVSYSGDANNAPVAGACNDANETTEVGRVTPAITTLASPDVVFGAGQLSDQATVTGLVNPTGPQSVSFELFLGSACNASTYVGGQRVALTLNAAGTGGTAQSSPFSPPAPGEYRWIATYNGDPNNAPIAGTCGEATETRNVTRLAVVAPPPPPPPPPPPDEVVAGTAATKGKTGCQSKPFRVEVRGTKIRLVVFYLDGKRVGRLRGPNRLGGFSKTIYPAKLKRGTHRVITRIYFRKSSKTKTKTQRVVFSVCKRKATPRFTG